MTIDFLVYTAVRVGWFHWTVEIGTGNEALRYGRYLTRQAAFWAGQDLASAYAIGYNIGAQRGGEQGGKAYTGVGPAPQARE